jgi:hypothetical protein
VNLECRGDANFFSSTVSSLLFVDVLGDISKVSRPSVKRLVSRLFRTLHGGGGGFKKHNANETHDTHHQHNKRNSRYYSYSSYTQHSLETFIDASISICLQRLRKN